MTPDPESAARCVNLAACKADACRQGRNRCPTPLACGLSEPEDEAGTFLAELADAIVGILIGAFVVMVVGTVIAAIVTGNA